MAEDVEVLVNLWSYLFGGEATLTKQPWREQVKWDDEEEMKITAVIRQLSPKIRPSILFIGPVGAGKSSFINSVLSILKGRKVDCAQTGDYHDTSCTRKFDRYLLDKYTLRDCMGIESTPNRGCLEEDISYLLKGHIRQGYPFIVTVMILTRNVVYFVKNFQLLTEKSITAIRLRDQEATRKLKFDVRKAIDSKSEYFRINPKFRNQIHCVVFVVDAKVMRKDIAADYVRKIKSLQRIINELDIPRVLLLTKTDKLCQEVGRDITKLYNSIKVKEAVTVASEVFGIPLASIHPVVNFVVEPTLNKQRNIQILMPLRQILQYAEDRIDVMDMINGSESDGDDSEN